MSDLVAVPEGYEVLKRTQGPGFGGLVGPFYAKREGREISLGLRIEPRHLNSRGTCHGGLLATLADVALGYACAAVGEDGQGRNFVTIDLAIEYMARTQAGDWLYSRVQVLNADTRTASAAGHLLVEDRPVARISANFRMARTRAPLPAGAEEKK
jgi:acyl-coenzyme A thioesterase 13